MNCYQHRDNTAHGICKVCGRGVCFDCAAEVGHSLACKNLHEEQAAALHRLTVRSTVLLKVSRKARFLAPAFLFVFGLVTLAEGMAYANRANFITYVGLVFTVLALIILLLSIRAYSAQDGAAD